MQMPQFWTKPWMWFLKYDESRTHCLVCPWDIRPWSWINNCQTHIKDRYRGYSVYNHRQMSHYEAIAPCRLATSHYLNQWLPSFLTPYGVTRPPGFDAQCRTWYCLSEDTVFDANNYNESGYTSWCNMYIFILSAKLLYKEKNEDDLVNYAAVSLGCLET